MLTDKVTTLVTFSLRLKAIFDTRFGDLVWVGPCEGEGSSLKGTLWVGGREAEGRSSELHLSSVKSHPDHPFGSFQKLRQTPELCTTGSGPEPALRSTGDPSEGACRVQTAPRLFTARPGHPTLVLVALVCPPRRCHRHHPRATTALPRPPSFFVFIHRLFFHNNFNESHHNRQHKPKPGSCSSAQNPPVVPTALEGADPRVP